MRASFALVAFAAVASASSLNRRQLPACALTCMTSADTGSCGTDNTCLCKNQAFIDSVYNCLATTCSADDLEAASAGARALCAAAGVTLTSTPVITATATATSPVGSVTASTTGAASGTTGAASATPTSNSAIAFSGASPMVGALAAMAGFVFAL